jgi:3,4-dihydroxy 2-butanone 4-phosphate synthase/GTP cyclohydrolase II
LKNTALQLSFPSTNRETSEYYILDKTLEVPGANEHGTFLMGAYRVADPSGKITDHLLMYTHLAAPICNLRLNSACFTGDLLHCRRCDCAWQLQAAIQYIQRVSQGLLIYHLDHEGRGNGLLEKLRSFGPMTDDSELDRRYGLPDQRDFYPVLRILEDLSIKSVNLLTNNPEKTRVLADHGIEVAQVIPLVEPSPHLTPYYRYKQQNLMHTLSLRILATEELDS